MGLATALGQAREHLRQGRLPEARAAAERLTRQAPDRAEIWLLAGRVHEAMGEPHPAFLAYDQALVRDGACLEALAGRARIGFAHGEREQAVRDAEAVLNRDAANVPMLLLLASAHQKMGHAAQAEEAYRRVLALEPRDPVAVVSLVRLLGEKGRLREGLDLLAVHLKGPQDDARMLLARADILWRHGSLREALTDCRRAATLFPGDAFVRATLGRYLLACGDEDQGLKHLRAAQRITPGHPVFRIYLSVALLRLEQVDTAWIEAERAVLLGPNSPDAYCALGSVHKTRGDLFSAELCYHRALAVQPDFAMALYGLALVQEAGGHFDAADDLYTRCLHLSPDVPEVHNNLGVLRNLQGRSVEALAFFERAVALKPDDPSYLSNLLLTMLHVDTLDRDTLRRYHFSYGKRFEKTLAPVVSPRPRSRPAGRSLRLGYLSRDFRTHSVAFFLESLWRHHDRSRFCLHAYHTYPGRDTVTETLAGLADVWRDIAALSDEKAAEAIRQDHIDILVDLGGHTSGNRLPVFARKPAPLQVTYLGYPATTGLAVMDARITDQLADPPEEAAADHTERLAYVQAPFLCYTPPRERIEVAPELPSSRSGTVTFGSFNKLAKLSDTVLGLWRDILLAVPGARLVVKDICLDEAGCRAHLRDRLARQGLPEDRVSLLPGEPSLSQHLRRYGGIDIALDTFPYHGTTTTCEALWMGVPVVSLVGRQHHSRVGLSLLTSVGLGDLAPTRPEAYVAAAVALAGEASRRAFLRRTLRRALEASPLLDGKRLARSLENTLWELWRQAGGA